MVDVPNLPGVPPLTNYSTDFGALIFGDALSAITQLFQPVWGIYIAGQPIITPASSVSQQVGAALGVLSSLASLIGVPNVVPVVASTIEFDYSADAPISTYPQEEGAFQSYDKVQLPFDVKLRLASSQRQEFFSTLEALRTSLALVDIVTPDGVYSSCNCKHVDYRRTSRNGVDLVLADVWFEQVRVISATSFSNTKSPTDSSTQALGNVQPQTPSANVVQQFNGLGGAPY